MPRLSLENIKSLTEVVYDVKSPHDSKPRAGCERRSRCLLRRLHRLNQSNPIQASPPDTYCPSILCASGGWLNRQSSDVGPEPFEGRPERLCRGRTRGGYAIPARRRLLDDDTGRRLERSHCDDDRREGRFVRRLRHASPWPAVRASSNRGS